MVDVGIMFLRPGLALYHFCVLFIGQNSHVGKVLYSLIFYVLKKIKMMCLSLHITGPKGMDF